MGTLLVVTGPPGSGKSTLAAGRFVSADYETVFDGIVGPWFLPTFHAASGVDALDDRHLLDSGSMTPDELADILNVRRSSDSLRVRR